MIKDTHLWARKEASLALFVKKRKVPWFSRNRPRESRRKNYETFPADLFFSWIFHEMFIEVPWLHGTSPVLKSFAIIKLFFNWYLKNNLFFSIFSKEFKLVIKLFCELFDHEFTVTCRTIMKYYRNFYWGFVS